ncbi:Hypothetical protein LBF_4239 [Leptospira biflexa serovar Patoc strain 'Patoc 1 (Ames)']|uniref:Uncharacterized protein n=1 Tax=Leptospira biflexa serovar Patoc (strain Patoc 1 / ATCC 23582 / Paris) TaxID=456481 RepID=B0SUA0_LEPBP|nr:hypothetical protein [Leptospira biflexa]ABZ96061.1 Hypothetical protein LBF_4239 [Leptospira biflexa serovar Patoc strain 'Patoc 1 (Ames)']ABZ99784.1 Hypothetical protein; putative signal peptide [Leptospira biflexa serovar Patoc strain 'Patoc 1 (Paris)']
MNSPQASVFVSLISGFGLLAVVALAPIQENQVKKLEMTAKPQLAEKKTLNFSIEANHAIERSKRSEFSETPKDAFVFFSLVGDNSPSKRGIKRSNFSYSFLRFESDVSPANFSVLDAKLSGEPALSQSILTTSNHPSANMIFRQIEANKRTLYDPKLLYEYQGNFSASPFLKVQTSIYNIKTENPVASYGAEGGKFSFFFGSDQIQLNVKYNYVNQRPSASNGQIGFVPAQDIASLGLIFFLGSSKNYSLYLGNQIFNVFNDPLLRVRDQNGRSPETFSASFRGKPPGNQKTTFFLNFQNQFYKDGVLYGVPGGYMVGNTFNGKSFYEYVTSLGMELAF